MTGDSIFTKTGQSIRENIKDDFGKFLSYHSIGMAFLFSVIMVSAIAGLLRLTCDYVNYKNANLQTAVSETVDENNDLKIINSSPTWINFLNNVNPLTLAAAEAATPSQPLLQPPVTEPVWEESPLIRVGLFSTNRWHLLSASGNYRIISSTGEIQLSSSGDKAVKIWYDRSNKFYFWEQDNLRQSSVEPFQVVADKDSILKLETYSNPPKWNWSLPDNQFRGALELRHSDVTDRIWMINELPLENYLKGLGETRATDDPEYLKVMSVVGRSYAYSHMLDDYKHDSEYFHVDAYWDQVYRGYDNEVRHTELVQAVADTFGQVVTYNNEVAVTPYFARSNGRTKSWSEVWYQDPYPWVQSVEVPEEKGFSQLGHGVGLSAVGAMLMAEEGMDYKEIIEYFYNNVKVTEMY